MVSFFLDIKSREFEPRNLIQNAALYNDFNNLLDHFRKIIAHVRDEWFFVLVLDKKWSKDHLQPF